MFFLRDILFVSLDGRVCVRSDVCNMSRLQRNSVGAVRHDIQVGRDAFQLMGQQRAGSITLCDDMMELNIWRGVITIIKQNHASQRLSKCSKSNRLPHPLSLICEESLLMCRLIC